MIAWRLLYRWLPVGAWMALIFFLSAQPNLPRPNSGWLDWVITGTAHTVEYGVLAVLVARALPRARRAWLIVPAVAVLYALSDELHQWFVPGRHADPVDLLLDALGAAAGLLAWRYLRRPRPLDVDVAEQPVLPDPDA